MSGTGLTIVIPAYNEAERLPPTLRTIREFVPDADVVVVDDGSNDGTEEVARARGVRVLSYRDNRGKGHALRVGMMAATGDHVLFTDADLSTPIHELPRLLDGLRRGFDIVIGSRKREGARLIRRQPWLRETLGKGFTLLSQIILGVRATDFTCGFKAFTRAAARAVFSRSTIDRWGFDSEILFIAQRLGLRMAEVPVTWEDNRQTKVRLGADVVRSFVDLVRIRMGRYHARS